MDLDENELGYFIQQVGLAALSYGVSQADATAAGGALMTLFGYRCSPATAITGAAVLQSMCTAKTCPLDPKANCAAYPWYGVSYPPEVNPSCAPAATTAAPTYAKSTAAAAPAPSSSGSGQWKGWQA